MYLNQFMENTDFYVNYLSKLADMFGLFVKQWLLIYGCYFRFNYICQMEKIQNPLKFSNSFPLDFMSMLKSLMTIKSLQYLLDLLKELFKTLWGKYLEKQADKYWRKATFCRKLFIFEQIRWALQGLIEKNSLGVGNVNMSTTRYVLGYYTFYRLLAFRSKLNINLLFCFLLQY